jgi:hypothetical protein
LTLKNHNLFTDQLPASGKTPQMYLESLKYCLLGDELADLVLPHWPDQNDAIFSCSFVQPVLDLADK